MGNGLTTRHHKLVLFRRAGLPLPDSCLDLCLGRDGIGRKQREIGLEKEEIPRYRGTAEGQTVVPVTARILPGCSDGAAATSHKLSHVHEQWRL